MPDPILDQNTNNQTPSPDTTPTPPAQGETLAPASFEEFLKGQPEQVKALYTQHVTGLTNAVKATRQERDDLAKQVKDLIPQVQKGSEAEKALTEFAAKLESAEKRAVFFEEAIKPEVDCTNPRLAWTLAQADNLFDRKGQPDWAAIKAAAPELFRKVIPAGNAGTGTQNNTPSKVDFNAILRQAAGR